ncbi:hypothetical protein OF83DRAFT_938230 [Amylostereum chailletii]|nr:hypothetical protein OF83DRAFT_938230 [Amylostereum chailletii]
MSTPPDQDSTTPQDLLLAFQDRYLSYLQRLEEVMVWMSDSTVLERLGDDLDEFTRLVEQHSAIFPPLELQGLLQSLQTMRHDVQLQYREVLDQSHHGRPTIVREVHTGGPGRPSIWIDPDWLRWAYGHHPVSQIARFLGVGRTTVRAALLEHGIAQE